MDWLATRWQDLVIIVVTAVGIYGALILFTRIAGLRSFAKMSSFDFAMTVAIGSVLASSVVSIDTSLLQGVVALGSLYLLQKAVGAARQRWRRVGEVVDNRPLVLLANGEIVAEHLQRAEVTRDDLFAKLREHNVFELSEVRAVVLETTGTVSVLQSGDPDQPLAPEIMEGVIGRELVLTV